MKSLIKQYLPATAPEWLVDALAYETLMGSITYGANDETSDIDVYAFVLPPKEIVYPHLIGAVQGFDTDYPKFEHYEALGIETEVGNVNFNVYGLVKYLRLIADGNPNMLDSLFTDDKYVLTMTQPAQYLKAARKAFITLRAVKKCIGYSRGEYSRLSKTPAPKRKPLVAAYGYDTKSAYHAVRMLLNAEQMLSFGNIHLDAHAPFYQSIRKGEIPYEYLVNWYEKRVAKVYELLAENPIDLPDRFNQRAVVANILKLVYPDAYVPMEIDGVW